MEARAQEFYPQVEHLVYAELAGRFPYFRFPAGVRALYQATHAGHLDPRQHISAQNRALELLGGVVIDDVVTELDAAGPVLRVRHANGWAEGRKVILATGAFANAGGIIPRKINFGVVPHTVVLGEISPAQLPALAEMPSLSYRFGDDPMRYVYFLPPIKYPDGKHYVKIGHSKGDSLPNDWESLVRWFQSDGDPTRIEWLSETLHKLLPDVKFNSMHSRSCVTTKSPTGKQFIDQFDDPRIYGLLADNGQCAKSADELGYMAATFVQSGRFPAPYNREDFRLVYA
jgi:sarcosine oxidase